MLTLQQMTQDLYGFTAPPVPADCAAQYTGSEAWMCLWPSYRLPYIQTESFLNAAQLDAFQIMCVRAARTRFTNSFTLRSAARAGMLYKSRSKS